MSFLAGMVVGAVMATVQAWFVMVGFAILHIQEPGVPALGFWACVTLSAIVDLLVVVPVRLQIQVK